MFRSVPLSPVIVKIKGEYFFSPSTAALVTNY